MKLPRVYLAGKIKSAAQFSTIRDQYRDRLIITSRWIDHVLSGRDESPEEASSFWIEDIDDIRVSDCVVIWAQVDDRLEGALIEAGAAIALGKRVYLTGHYPYKTWQSHPLVSRSRNLLSVLSRLARGD